MKILKILDLERASALVTWLLVSGSALYYLFLRYEASHWQPWLALVMFMLLAVCFALITREDNKSLRWRCALLVGIYILSVASLFLLPFSYLAIFLVIWSALLPYYLSWRTSLMLSVPAIAPMSLIHTYFWHDNNALLTATLFWSFNLFAMMMSKVAIKEKDARAKADSLNRQLLSTQQLIRQASQQDERLRIARNIHDVLGHHLTALTIHLQVASHKAKSSGNADIQKHVDQCHGLAKLLLGDVREAVSDIRDHATLNWEQAVLALFEALPRPVVDLSVADDVNIEDLTTADVLLRCVQESLTNTIKHSQSRKLSVDLHKAESNYVLTMQDDQGRPKGNVNVMFAPGNGLQGMAERVEGVGGIIESKFNEKGFFTKIILPGAL